MSDIEKAFPPVREPAQHDLYAVYIALMKSGLATYLPSEHMRRGES